MRGGRVQTHGQQVGHLQFAMLLLSSHTKQDSRWLSRECKQHRYAYSSFVHSSCHFRRQDLLLDSAIRDWVLLPILLVMMLVGLLRHYITQLITNVPKPTPPAQLREQRIITRAQNTRANAWYMDPDSLAARREWLSEKLGSGEYVRVKEEVSGTRAVKHREGC